MNISKLASKLILTIFFVTIFFSTTQSKSLDKYNDGKSYSTNHSKSNFEEPIFFFNPAVAPSALNRCPKNLLDYYGNNNCLIGLICFF